MGRDVDGCCCCCDVQLQSSAIFSTTSHKEFIPPLPLPPTLLSIGRKGTDWLPFCLLLDDRLFPSRVPPPRHLRLFLPKGSRCSSIPLLKAIPAADRATQRGGEAHKIIMNEGWREGAILSPAAAHYCMMMNLGGEVGDEKKLDWLDWADDFNSSKRNMRRLRMGWWREGRQIH
jgi:hypothetical protein